MAKTLIDYAVEWAEQGVPCFPCDGNKRPLTKNGFYDAETEPNKVRTLFEFYGDAVKMIGGRMGKEAGLFVVDVDLYKGKEVEAWYKAAIDDGSLVETRTHTTKNGGVHLMYESDEYFPNVNPVKGVEVKGEGGYVILPGSPGYKVAQTGLAKAPPKLLERLRYADVDRRGQTVTDLEANVLSADDFHSSLTQIASKMAFSGKSMVDIQIHIKKLLSASVASSPAHDRHSRWRTIMEDRGGELTRIVKSGYKKYSDDAAMEDFAELADMDQLLDDAEGVFPQLGEGGVAGSPKLEVIYDEDEWPFQGQGHWAHEDIDLTDMAFNMHPWFAENETVVMYAEPKTGKTAVALSTALHIACGIDYGALTVPESGPTIYYALEGTRAVELRVAAWRKTMKENEIELPDIIPMFTVKRSVNFLEKDRREQSAKQIIAANKTMIKHTGKPLKAIYIDTLTKAMTGGDQNSVDDTSKMFDIVPLIREGGVTATVVFIHHKSKQGGARGSTNIEAEPDVLLDVSKKKSVVEVRIAKARSIEDGFKYHFDLVGVSLGKTKQGHKLTGVVAEPTDVPENDDADTAMENHMWDERIGSMRKAIVNLGVGEHTIKAVAYHLFQEGLMDEFKRPEFRSASAQELFHKIASTTGTVWNGRFIISLDKNKTDVTGFTVRVAS